MDYVNKVLCGECSEVMKGLPDSCIDLVVTSPPYDQIRKYKGYTFDYAKVIEGLYRIMKPGSCVVWVVGDSVIDGRESLSSFKHVFKFDEVGFWLHDTMIYEKNGSAFPARRTANRNTQIFEYMFVFSKGKPKTAHLICDKKNKWVGWTNWGKKSGRDKDGNLVQQPDIKPIPEFSPRTNIWKYNVGGGFMGDDSELLKNHSAVMSEKLCQDHIIQWSNPGDVVLDPMAGSGTTCKMSLINGRSYVAIEISPEYCEIIEKRLDRYKK